MGKALAVVLRRGGVDAVDDGGSGRSGAARFGVRVSAAIRWGARDRERGDLEPEKRGGNTRSHRIDAHRELIMSWIEEAPDLTLDEVAERLDAATGYRPQRSIVCRFFQRHDVTLKKRRRMLANRIDRTSPGDA